MAFTKSLSIHIDGIGVIDVPNAHCVINCASYDKMAGTVSFRALVWKDESTSDLATEAVRSMTMKKIEHDAALRALSAFAPVGGESSEDIKRLESESEIPRQKEKAARALLDEAVASAKEFKTLPGSYKYEFGPGVSEMFITNGAVDELKCEIWLITQPPWAL